ncbi:MAG TPA: glycosyltransferase family 9 protein [Alphaproteobacteria bacterium]|nr:glycosyltransferase family 9 protein [Alphaproteobacteria bacterium]
MNILFITHTRVGDAVLSTGVLARLIERHPGARITIACGPAAIDIFRAVPGLEQIHVLEKRSYGRHWLKLWRQAALRRWDIVVDLRASAIAYFLVAGRRYISTPSKEMVHRLFHLARVIGEKEALAPRIWTAPEHWHNAIYLLPDGPPPLAVAPTANWRGKMWRGARFAELLERLTAPDGIMPSARVVILGAESERNLAQPVLASVRAARRVDLIGKVDLLTAFMILRRCALFIGNDSGLMHLAAASGVPTLGLFGPSRVEVYAPWGPHADTVSTELSYDALVGQPGYDHRTTDTLMDSLTVDMVENAAIRLWRRSLGQAA